MKIITSFASLMALNVIRGNNITCNIDTLCRISSIDIIYSIFVPKFFKILVILHKNIENENDKISFLLFILTFRFFILKCYYIILSNYCFRKKFSSDILLNHDLITLVFCILCGFKEESNIMSGYHVIISYFKIIPYWVFLNKQVIG